MEGEAPQLAPSSLSSRHGACRGPGLLVLLEENTMGAPALKLSFCAPRLTFLRGVLIAGAVAALPDGALGAAYKFTKIADTEGGLEVISIANVDAFNDSGEAVFYGQTAVTHATAMYKGSGGPLTSIDHGDYQVGHTQTGAINNAGTVAFAGIPPMTSFISGVYFGNGGGVGIVLQDNSGSNPQPPIGNALTINDSNLIALSAGRSGYPDAMDYRNGIYLLDGSGFTIVAEVGPVYSGVHTYAPPINNAGQVAFWATSVADNEKKLLRYEGEGLPLTTLATAPSLYSDGRITMNNDGDVAYFDPTEPAIKLYHGGVTSTIASYAGPYGAFPMADSYVNDSEDVAFTAALDGFFVTGVYTGPDAVADKVIAPGDVVFGREVRSATAHGLNNHGQVLVKVDFGGSPESEFALVAATPLLAGDFDEDTDVDNNDLTNWRGGFGSASGASHLEGDGDYDLDADGRDFLIWQRDYGDDIDAAATAVPEPSCALLAGLVPAAVGRLGRRRLPKVFRMLRLPFRE
jgi:hypothetical protein